MRKADADTTLLLTVAQEIEHGLFMVNDAVALRDGPLKKAKPEDLDESAEKGRHRKVEKKRRATSHETLGGMSFFFKAPPRSLSRNKVLFFGKSNTLIPKRLTTYHSYSSHHISHV